MSKKDEIREAIRESMNSLASVLFMGVYELCEGCDDLSTAHKVGILQSVAYLLLHQSAADSQVIARELKAEEN